MKNSVGLEPCTLGSTRLHLTTTPQRLITQLLGKVLILFLFHETAADKMITSCINQAINSGKTVYICLVEG